jgi:hypothetical protein
MERFGVLTVFGFPPGLLASGAALAARRDGLIDKELVGWSDLAALLKSMEAQR